MAIVHFNDLKKGKKLEQQVSEPQRGEEAVFNNLNQPGRMAAYPNRPVVQRLVSKIQVVYKMMLNDAGV